MFRKVVGLLVAVLFPVVPFLALIESQAGGAVLYSAFNNSNRGDCVYEVLANLTLFQFPNARITDGMVLSALDGFGPTDDGAVSFMRWGFDGHRARLVLETRPVGREVWAGSDWLGHAYGLVDPLARGAFVINDGGPVWNTWASVWAEMGPESSTQFYRVVWR